MFARFTVLLWFVSCICLWGQAGTAELEITVVDPGGLPMEGAQVSLEESKRGRSWSAVTNSAGHVRLLGLPPGAYRLTAERHDFQPATADAIRLRTGDRVSLEIRLKLPGHTESLEVRAERPVLETGRGGVAAVVDEKLVEGLPLDGRNFIPLIATLPGVALARGSAFPRLNGSRPRTNEYVYDGVSVLQPEPGQVAYYPVIDAIEEFRVDLNSYSAEFGRSNGGVVQVRHKSGSNDLHVTLFEFLRHEQLNARNLFAEGGAKALFRRNQYGFTAGGPLRRNRTFVFAEFQGTRLRTGRTLVSTVPTAAERAGEFSRPAAPTIYDPATTTDGSNGTTREPFPNARIPASRLDPVAIAAVQRYPDVFQPGANNYRRTGSETQDQDQLGLRLDHDFAARHRVFGRWAGFRDRTTPVAPLPDGSGRIIAGPLGASRTRSQAFVGEHTWTVGPRTLNQLRVGHTRRTFTSEQLRTGRSPLEELGLPGLSRGSFPDALPTFTADGFQQIGPSANANVDFSTSVTQIVETLSLIRGAHSVKVGGDIRRQRLNMLQPSDPAGRFRFTAPMTGLPSQPLSGNAIASMLLGEVESFRIDLQEEVLRPRARNVELFAQDDWKASARLTVNVGMRYTLNLPSTERNDRAAVFDTENEELRFLGRDGRSRSARKIHWNNWGPRLGVAWRARQNLAVRAGYGLAWFEMAGITTPFTTPFFPFIQTIGEASLDSLTPAFRLADGPAVEPLVAAPDAGLGQGVFGVDRSTGSGYAQQWSLTVQRSLGASTSFEVGYLGSSVTRLGVPDGNLNQLTVEELAQGRTLLESVENPYFGSIPSSSSLGRRTISRAQLLKPRPRFTAVSLYRNNTGHSTYHGLQSSLERRLQAGLTFRLAYTFSKLIDDASAVFSASALTGPVMDFPIADSRNRRLERDVSGGDIPHVFAGSWVWEPALLRGWRLGGILRLQSGVPVPVQQQPNFNAFAGFGSQRPNRRFDPNLAPGERTTSRYFDTAAFAAAPQFTLGNSPRHPLRGPGWRTLDLMLGRIFRLKEAVELEVRAQAFNVTNTPPLGEPVGVFGSAAFGSVISAGDPRVFELAAKLRF